MNAHEIIITANVVKFKLQSSHRKLQDQRIGVVKRDCEGLVSYQMIFQASTLVTYRSRNRNNNVYNVLSEKRFNFSQDKSTG